LGLPLFLPARAAQAQDQGQLIFSIRRNSIEGQGQYTDEGFVVLAGSRFHKAVAPSLTDRAILKRRDQLITDKLLIDKGDYFELQEDTIFSSPSNAGASVTGRSTNGWTAWKLKDGRTLSDIYRKEDLTGS